MFEKAVIVTKETQLDQLVKKFSTKAQAVFYIAQAQRSYKAKARPAAASSKQLKEEESTIQKGIREIETADSMYKSSVDRLKRMVPPVIKVQHIDWSYLPGFIFAEKDLVITVGPDGLVINTAKYLRGQPIFSVNPDPARIDGILIPFGVEDAEQMLPGVLDGNFDADRITIARASLNDGQEIMGVNDIFIGPKSHTSFRYGISFQGTEENQSSSGIIVSTGTGSTGWFRSIIEGARHVSSTFDGAPRGSSTSRFSWDADYLYFTVREPFESMTSSCSVVFGRIQKQAPLVVTSQMPQNGVIFSDGIESDFIEFNAGKIATISLAEEKAYLIKKV